MQTKKIYIKGMHCVSCEKLLDDEFRSIDNVKNVRVNRKTNSAEIDYDGQAPDFAEIKRVAEKYGYEAFENPPAGGSHLATKSLNESLNETSDVSSWVKAVLIVAVLLFLLTVFPLFLLYRVSRLGRLGIKSLLVRLVFIVAIFLTFLPLWIGGYLIVGTTIVYRLGYIPEDLTIVGTGSMYPTWPKGTKGKTPKELAEEVVGNTGFLKYPNGLVLFGSRILGHQIGREDIVVVEDDKTRKLTQVRYGSPSGWLKRAIAVGGDTLEIKDGIVYLNSQPLKEPYIAKARSTFGESFLKECNKITVPENSIFVLGDILKGIGDSR